MDHIEDDILRSITREYLSETTERNKEEIVEAMMIYHEELLFQNDELKLLNQKFETIKKSNENLFIESPIPQVIIDQDFSVIKCNTKALNDLNGIGIQEDIRKYISYTSQDDFHLCIRSMLNQRVKEERLELDMQIKDKKTPVSLFLSMVRYDEKESICVAFVERIERKG